MEYKDYYKILGVSREADAKAIKSAYRKKAKQYHPDLHPEHAEKFKELAEAYDVLGDEEKRRHYDALGANWKHGGSGGGVPPQYQQWAGGQAVNFEDFFGGASRSQGGASGFSDFFEAFFGGGRGARASQTHGQNAYTQNTQTQEEDLDITQPITISLNEAIQGGERELYSPQLKRNVPVKIPKGISTGKKIRIQQAGRASQYQAGVKGNLLLLVSLDLPKGTHLEGLDITQNCEVPIWRMILGGKQTVRLPSGASIEIQIPPYSQTGQKLRIRGEGLPDLKKSDALRGNLYLKLMPRLPQEGDPDASAWVNAMQLFQQN
jgi:curved DNA-binding protein